MTCKKISFCVGARESLLGVIPFRMVSLEDFGGVLVWPFETRSFLSHRFEKVYLETALVGFSESCLIISNYNLPLK